VYKHNDFEIISLIREGDQDALQLMFEKYTPLIYKKIYHFHLGYEKEDIHQECLMVLYNSILKFNMDIRKTFTRYFEMNLERKLISIVTKKVRRQQIMEENIDYIYTLNSPSELKDKYFPLYVEEISKILTKTENLVYTLRELKNYSIEYIKENYQLEEKVIYNSLYRAKIKISSHFST